MIKDIKSVIIYVLVLSCLGLVIANYRSTIDKRILEGVLYSERLANLSEVDSIKGVSIAHLSTIDNIKKSSDSISNELVLALRDLRLKDKQIKSLSYLKTKSQKVDTIIFKDTILKKDVKIDTLLKDKWYELNLKLNYPSKIITNPKFYNDMSIITSYKKEYVNKRHWLFFVRWFQKKHTVVRVDVVDSNPYTTIDTLRHIEIIK